MESNLESNLESSMGKRIEDFHRSIFGGGSGFNASLTDIINTENKGFENPANAVPKPIHQLENEVKNLGRCIKPLKDKKNRKKKKKAQMTKRSKVKNRT